MLYDLLGGWYVLCFVVFFFQAEDGIRDLVRSRGLGDVYKRQIDGVDDDAFARRLHADNAIARNGGAAPVSYTHLTLPTSDLV